MNIFSLLQGSVIPPMTRFARNDAAMRPAGPTYSNLMPPQTNLNLSASFTDVSTSSSPMTLSGINLDTPQQQHMQHHGQPPEMHSQEDQGYFVNMLNKDNL